MSVALNRSGSGGDHHRSVACAAASIYNCTEFAASDREFPMVPDVQHGPLSQSSSSSSIGKDSDESGGCGGAAGGEGGDEEEVESELKGGPLESLDGLEKVLPVKRSISRYYCGKSKSFTSLSDATSCSSIKEITKPENIYTRKRKNLLTFSNFLEKNRNMSLRSNGGISNRHTNSRSMLSLVASPESNNISSANLSSRRCCLPPLPPIAQQSVHCELPVTPSTANFSSLWSFSLSDLQGTAAVEASSRIVGQNIKNDTVA